MTGQKNYTKQNHIAAAFSGHLYQHIHNAGGGCKRSPDRGAHRAGHDGGAVMRAVQDAVRRVQAQGVSRGPGHHVAAVHLRRAALRARHEWCLTGFFFKKNPVQGARHSTPGVPPKKSGRNFPPKKYSVPGPPAPDPVTHPRAKNKPDSCLTQQHCCHSHGLLAVLQFHGGGGYGTPGEGWASPAALKWGGRHTSVTEATVPPRL